MMRRLFVDINVVVLKRKESVLNSFHDFPPLSFHLTKSTILTLLFTHCHSLLYHLSLPLLSFGLDLHYFHVLCRQGNFYVAGWRPLLLWTVTDQVNMLSLNFALIFVMAMRAARLRDVCLLPLSHQYSVFKLFTLPLHPPIFGVIDTGRIVDHTFFRSQLIVLILIRFNIWSFLYFQTLVMKLSFCIRMRP